MSSVEEYRRHAAQCLSLAQNAESAEDRTRLLQMAEAWRELADRLAQKIEAERALQKSRTNRKLRGQ